MTYNAFKSEVDSYLEFTRQGVQDLDKLSYLYSVLTGAKVDCKPCMRERMEQMLKLYQMKEPKFKPAVTLILDKMAKKNTSKAAAPKTGKVSGYKFSQAYNDIKKSNFNQGPVINATINGQMVSIRSADQLTDERAKALLDNPRYAHLIEEVRGEAEEEETPVKAFDTSSGTIEGDTQKPGQILGENEIVNEK